MDHAGAVLGPLLATGLLAALATDLRTVFWLATIPALASVTVLALAVQEEPGGPSGTEQAPAGPSGPLTSDAQLPRFLLLVVLFTLGNSSDAFLLLKAQQTGVPVALLPILWAALHVVKALASVPGGALSDRWGRGRVLASGWLLYAAVYAGFAVVSSAVALWALTLTYGLYFGLTEGVERALIADLAPPARRGSVYGWYHLAIGIAALPSSLLMGALWQAFGSGVAFATGAAFALLAATFLPLALRAPRGA